MKTRNQPDPELLAEGIEIILDDLGVTIDELDARRGRFESESERRAWYVACALRRDGIVS